MIGNQPSSAIDDRLIQGLKFQDSGNFSSAEKIYREILRHERNNPDALHLLGCLALTKNDYQRAIELIRRAIAEQPKLNNYYNSLAAAYHGAGEFENALTSYRQALALNPHCTESLIGLGIIYKHRDAFQMAINCYLKAIAINPNLPMAYNNLGTAFLAQGHLIKAVSCFRQALRLDPDYKNGLLNLGNALQKMGNLEGAIACYLKILMSDVDFIPAHLNLGFVYQTMGRVDDAIDAFQKVLDRQPENSKALAYLYHQYQYACDWQQMERLSTKLDIATNSAIKSGKVPAEPPFLNISRRMDPKLNYSIARLWSRDIRRRAILSFSQKL